MCAEEVLLAREIRKSLDALEKLEGEIHNFSSTALHAKGIVEAMATALLRAMTLEIPGLRPRVVSDTTYRDLDEFRRFRHFTLYYFDVDYDWRRLSFLFDVFEGLRAPLRNELGAFATALEQAAS